VNRQADVTEALNGIAFGKGLFVAVGGGGVVLRSPDGIDWISKRLSPPCTLEDITFGDEKFIAICGSGAFSTPDGKNWTLENDFGGSTGLTRIAHGAGKFIAGGERGGIWTSVNGNDWTKRESGVSRRITSVAFLRDRFFAFVDGALPRVSEDAIVWREFEFESANLPSLLDGAFGNGRFLLGGQSGQVLTSEDGKKWTRSIASPYVNFYRIRFANGLFLSPVGSGVILSSVEGLKWTEIQTSKTGQSLSDLAFGNGRFVAVGPQARIIETVEMQSEPSIPFLNISAFMGIEIRGEVGKTYEIISADTSPSSNWRSLGKVSLPVSPYRWFDPNPIKNSQQRFYRSVLVE